MMASVVYLGSIIGFVIFPAIADNYGRRISLFFCWLTSTIGVILMVVWKNYWLIFVGNGLAGMGVNPTITLHFSFFSEHASNL